MTAAHHPELILHRGLFTTLDRANPNASAVAIKDGCFTHVGREHEILPLAGAQPITSLQYLLELQRDWARTDTYDMTTGVAKKWGGGYGIGINYARAMFGAHEG